MAGKLISCPDCGREVSKKATACPHCGSPLKSDRKSVGAGTGCLIVVGLLVVVGYIANQMNPRPEPTPAPSKTAGETREDRERAEAQVLCQRLIERSAQYDFEWTDGWLSTKFPRRARADDGTLTLQGDRIRMQNGFGAWQNQAYTCRYDPAKKLVVDLDIQAGRL